MPSNYTFCNIQLLLVSQLCHRTTLRPCACNSQKLSHKNAMESPNYCSILFGNYAKLRRNYAKIRRNYSTSLRHFWLTWPGTCEKNVAVQTCKVITRATTFGRTCPNDYQLVLAPCIVLFRSKKKRRSRNSKTPQVWNYAAARIFGYF